MQISITLPTDVIVKLKEFSDRSDIPLSRLVRRALNEWFSRNSTVQDSNSSPEHLSSDVGVHRDIPT